MSPSNRIRTVSFVSLAALVALSGCSSEPRSHEEPSLAAFVEEAPAVRGNDARISAQAAEASIPVSRLVRPGSPAIAALSGSAPTVSPAIASQVSAGSPAIAALEGRFPQSLPLEPAGTIVVGTDVCQTDADCVPDGCHATSCVAAAQMAPGELACTADLRYGTTDGGGCLCQAGLCAARLSAPPQGI